MYDIESLPATHPLLTTPRTALTPHLGFVTNGTYQVLYTQCLEAIAAWIAGNPVRRLA